MTRKLSYRKAKKGVAEQYGINISKEVIKGMGITPENREVKIIYDAQNKEIVIKAIKNK